MPNAPLRIVQAQSIFEPSVQIPYIQLKNNNNNKKNKNLNKKQNGKIEEEEEEIDSSESNRNQMNIPQGKKNVMENTPQLINSFCYVNDNIINQKNFKSNENLVNNNNEYSNNNIINILANNVKNNNRPKSKSKKNITYFNKNTLAILENFDLTNEEKLLYLLDNFKNIKIDPLIIKVLEDRKNKKITYDNKNANIYNDGQNYNEKDKNIFSLKKKINGDQNSLQSSINENNNYAAPQPVMKPVFPIDDKILFKNLEIYKINKDILDRPCPTKIDIDYNILNKLFIIWDFLITFKDIIFVEKVYDFEINKNILVFYNDLLGEENNYQYYKSVFISLLLLCIKNIPNVIPNLKDQNLFLLKSILDNLHSLSFNIILDSPLVVLNEITNCFLYNNSIEKKNLKIIQNVVRNVNNVTNKENFENNKIIFENEEYDDNIKKLDNNTKIYLLNIIIGLCFETILVKDKIRSEYENMNSLSFTKKGLDESLFDTEKRMKELNRMENFKTLATEIENLEKKLKELKGEGDKIEVEKEKEKAENNNDINIEENNETLKEKENENEKENNINMNMNIEEEKNKKKEIKELETQIDRYKSILIENEKLIERKKDINTKISEIIEKIYNLKTLRKKYLGNDYQMNEYYYFTSVPNKIYTKNKKKEEWGYFENKEDIQKLINKLTDKGKNEKKLKIILKFILSQMKEKEEKEKDKERFIEIEEQSKGEEKEKNDENNISNDDDIKLINENENKEAENCNGIQIKIEKISLAKQQNNENNSHEDENNKKTNNEVCNINLGVSTRKKNNINNKINKQKEKIEMDKIHIIEDDEDEEIEEDNAQNDLEENKIIEEKEIITLNKNKINNNPKKENEDNKPPMNQTKKELFTFIISEDRLPLNVILMKIDDVFSEYLVQFNKQWESEKNRSIWKSIITKNATDKNILTTLKMFNHKFKNPYKILSAEEEQELLLKDKSNKIANNFVFDDENGNNFFIPETNNLLMLSPKVKIWSKEMDLIDIDNYYNNYLLLNVYSREQLCYVVHFYEMAIFGLVHRREGKRKL